MRPALQLVPLALLAALATVLASPGALVTVLKCCPYGETLDPHTAEGPPACMRVIDSNASSASWAPRIYSNRQRSFLADVPKHWTVHAASRPACGDRARMVLAHPHNQPVYVMFEEGGLYLQETSELLAPGRFCVDSTAALVCPAKDDDHEPPPTSAASVASANAIDEGEKVPVKRKPAQKPRLRKCCIGDAVYSEAQSSCTRAPAPLAVDLWGPARQDAFLEVTGQTRDSFTVISGLPVCDKPFYALRGIIGAGVAPAVSPVPSAATSTTASSATSAPAARLDADGSVWVGGSALQPGDFCLDTMVDLGVVAVLACPGEDATPADDDLPAGDLRFTLYPALLFLSAFFLAATLLASCLLPAAYHQLHWRCQTNYVASLMVGDLLLAVTQVSGSALKGPFCVVIAILMHFLFLAAFFWLNTMCFNIWWTFRDLRPASVDKNQEAVRMRLYEAYAWGGPLVIAGVAAALDNLPADQYAHLLRPGFGDVKCWFRGDYELLPYFFGPVGVLLVINLCLFIATARELTCGLWKADGAKPTTERATLRRVCLKLVVVMGVTWVADVVSWVAGGPGSLWYFTDAMNALQGVLIFAVVGCQPHVWSAVKRLWCLRESRSEASRRAMHLSSTSHGPHSLGPDSFTTTTTSNGGGTPAKLQLQSPQANGNGAAPAANGNGLPPPPPDSETPC